MANILIHTLGSSGDFNPFMALALELRSRGHSVHWGVSPSFADKARAMGFEATSGGADPDWQSDLIRRLLVAHRTDPMRTIFEEVLIPGIVPIAEAMEPVARKNDLLISHTIQLAVPAVAERTGIPWISASPATLVHETAAYPPPGVAWKGCPPFLSRLGWRAGRYIFHGIDEMAAGEYRKLGVRPRRNVMAGGVYSRLLTIGLWSPAFFPRPPDWPDWFQVGGYARWDGPAHPEAPSVAVDGHPTILFTLGSSVVNHPGEFYETAIKAVAGTSWRAILLGAPADTVVPSPLRDRIQSVPYAPYADLFPRVDAVVHQGGVGTTQAACYYDVPALVVPRGFDQFENAAHVQREGWGMRLMPGDLSPLSLRFRLERLLGDRKIKSSLIALGATMRAEPGVARSADLVEATLASGRTPTGAELMLAG